MPEELNSLIAELVRLDSVNPALDPAHVGEGEIARFVARWAEEHGLEVHWLEDVPGRPSLVVTARGSGGPAQPDSASDGRVGGRNLLLNAHLDTVGVAGMSEPFVSAVRDGRLYGRGALDMKASLAACLLALADSRALGLRGDVILTAVADEEHGSIGTREALLHLRETGTVVDAAIVTEPTDLEIHVAHRGFSVLEVHLEGKASHTSQPEAGVNAVVHLGRLLAAVERQADALRSREAHPLLRFGSWQPVLVSGGRELFTTPAQASVTLERRTLPGEGPELVEAELRAMLDELSRADPDFRARQESVVAREPFETEPHSDIAEVLAGAITAVRGAAPERVGAPYWTDAALVAAAGIPTLLFGPVGGGIHQPEEWVDLASVAVMRDVLALVITDFCA